MSSSHVKPTDRIFSDKISGTTYPTYFWPISQVNVLVNAEGIPKQTGF